MAGSLERDVAVALEADPRLLPVLPGLLADPVELGPSSATVVSVLRDAGVAAGARALDLGCGKGVVAIALARDLGLRVEGVDALPAFVSAATAAARGQGVAARCTFRAGDLRERLGRDDDCDVVLMLALGPILGDQARTVAQLRRLARPGGLLVLDDGFLADGAVAPAGYEDYADHAETLRRLTSRGDEVVREVVAPADATLALNRRNTGLIRARAEVLKGSRPDLAALIDAYVARQEHETRILGKEVIDALWVLRRR